MSSTASEHVQRELRTLGKAIRSAIDVAEPGDVEEGLRIYGQLVNSVLDRRNTFRDRFGTEANSSWWNSAGREMEWLDRDIESFVDRAFKVPDQRVQAAIANFLAQLLDALRRSRQPEAHRALLRHAERFYYRSLDFPIEPRRRSAGEAILAAVGAYADFQIGARTKAASGLGDELPYLMQVIDFTVRTIRSAVDNNVATSAEQTDNAGRVRSGGVTAHAEQGLERLREMLDGLEFQSRQARGGPGPEMDEIRSRIGGYLLGLAAYILLRTERGQLDMPACAQLLSSVVTTGRRVPAEMAVSVALDDNAGFPWHMWEVDTWPRKQQGGAVGRIDDLIRAVGSIRLTEDPGAADEFIETAEETAAPSNAAYLLQTMANAARHAKDDDTLNSTYPGGIPQQKLATLAEQFDAHADELEEDAKDSRADLEVDAIKVTQFATEVVKAWTNPSVLRGDPAHASGQGDPPSTWWGYSHLLPKEFFIESDVFAEPGHVGQSVGTAMVRGETAAILEMLDEMPRQERTLSDVNAWVRTALTELRDKGLEPTVVVVNSWRAMREILGSDWSPTREEAEFEGARVVLEYTDHSPACYVVEIPKAVTVLRWVAPEDAGPLYANGRLLISVRDIHEPFAIELLNANPPLREGDDGRPMSQDQAVRRLRRSAQVRVWTKFEVAISDTNSGRWCRITDEDQATTA